MSRCLSYTKQALYVPRMCAAACVHISASTYDFLVNKVGGYLTKERGEIIVKVRRLAPILCVSGVEWCAGQGRHVHVLAARQDGH